MMRTLSVGNLSIGNHLPFVLIAGPCVIESHDHAMMMARSLKTITDRLNIGFVFKSSYDKANRTSISGVRGLGMEEGLEILSDIKRTLGVPTTTDVHAPEQCAIVAKDVDILQIPAFLCRQTDLLVAAAKTGRVLNVKKGQFLAPWDMINVVKKIEAAGNTNIMQCERGVSFGYNRLINDMRALPIMAQSGYPVCFDATHSVQEPGGKGDATGGERQHVQVLARSAIALGLASLFMEVHDNPDVAPSDGPNMVKLEALEAMLTVLKAFDVLAKENPISLDV